MPGVLFDQSSATRIANVVKSVERGGPPQDGSGRSPTRFDIPFIAEIISQSITHPGRYSWKQKQWQNGVLVDTNPLVFDTRHTLRELNGYSGMAAGQWVIATFVGMDANANDSADSSSNSLSSISSSAGSLTIEPVYSFTYNLPAGGARYQVLQKIDDKGTVGWDWPRVHDGAVGPPVPPDSSSSSGTSTSTSGG